MAENDWVKDHAGVYYFSVTTDSSVPGLFTGWHYPTLDTNLLIAAFVGPGWMGNYVPDSRPFPPVDHTAWCPNDGAQKVPTWAMTATGYIYPRPVTVRDIRNGGAPQAGAWNWKGQMNDFDVIGWTLFWDSVGWYKAHLDQLRSL
jgi:hypothetical protein